jgi:4'-phosphopantetheinyl transferase EntD
MIAVKPMDASTLLEAWRELLPQHIKVSAGPYLSLSSQPLTHLESASAGFVGAERLCELESGRFYAKRALAMLGISDIDLPVSPNRMPLWPDGTIGSITHVKKRIEGHCAVAVGHARDIRAIGIDAEYDAGFDPYLWPTVLTTRELGQIRRLPVDAREAEALKRWCIKEAVTKAAQGMFEPIEINTEPGHRDGWYEATTSHEQESANTWIGQTTLVNGFILASVVVPR